MLAALRSISTRPAETSLDEFRNAFRARWEDRRVPLAEVLDEETGIGFEAATGPGTEGSPLLAGLRLPPAARHAAGRAGTSARPTSRAAWPRRSPTAPPRSRSTTPTSPR